MILIMRRIVVLILLLNSCSGIARFPESGWEKAWAEHEFSKPHVLGKISSRDIFLSHRGNEARLLQPMRLVSYRDNFEEWHQMIELSIGVPPDIMRNKTRFYRTHILPAGTPVRIIGSKVFELKSRDEGICLANRYVTLLFLQHPETHKGVFVFYNMGSQNGMIYQHYMLADRTKVLLSTYSYLKPLPW